MRKGLIILSDLLDKDIIWLTKVGTVQTHQAGHALIQAGRVVDCVYILVDGHVDVMHAEQGKVADLGVGDIIGEMSFVEERVPNTDVVCRDTCRFLAVPRDVLAEELAVNDGFAARFYHALAVFLSDRLRTLTSGGKDDELGENLLDTIHVAGDRMLRLMDLLEGRA